MAYFKVRLIICESVRVLTTPSPTVSLAVLPESMQARYGSAGASHLAVCG